jgi:DNA repair exonuclease SbcCD nuclease subunit
MRAMGDDFQRAARHDVLLVHSSDLHVDDAGAHGPPTRGPSGLAALAAVLATARALAADVVLLAGDTFDNARVPAGALHRAAEMIAGAGRPVVLLPGNHDAALADCLFRRAGLLDLPNATVLGVGRDEALLFEELGLEVWGRAHRGRDDLEPIGAGPPRRSRWRVAMAHGHYVPPDEARWHAHRAWRIADAQLEAAAADYVALGHWDRAVRVGPDRIEAHYSGSPDLAGTVNLVRLGAGGVTVSREALRMNGAQP